MTVAHKQRVTLRGGHRDAPLPRSLAWLPHRGTLTHESLLV
ncbi:hypothetical protein ACFRFQ_28910 [Rhodococcus sp. NPDC056743]